MVDPLPLFQLGVIRVLSDHGHSVRALLYPFQEEQIPQLLLLSIASEADWAVLESLSKQTNPPTLIAVLDPLTTQAGVRAIRAGAASAISRSDTPKDVLIAVEAALDHRSILPISVLEALKTALTEKHESRRISEQQLSWLKELAEGATVKQLAASVGYSERAVYRLLRRTYQELGARNRLQAVTIAREQGLMY